MKQLTYISTYHAKVYQLKTGNFYQVNSNGKERTCLFIRTSHKGFNFLDITKGKCIFKRTVYQEDSARKSIGRNQQVFDVVIPETVGAIARLNRREAKTAMIDMEKLHARGNRADKKRVRIIVPAERVPPSNPLACIDPYVEED